jgi:hypothetical protein
MKKWSPIIYGGTGVVAGFALAVVLGANEPGAGRYKLEVWSQSPSSTLAGDHGAFRIDTQTGTAWRIDANAGKTTAD